MPTDPQDRSAGRTNLFVGLLATAMGALILLVSLGIVFPGTKPPEAGRWVGIAAGAAFLLAGIVVVLQTWAAKPDTPEGELPPDAPMWLRVTTYLFGLLIVASLAAIASWVAFGPGNRAFTGFTSFLPHWLDEAVGRSIFGTGAIITWLILIALAIVGAKRLRGQK